MLQPFANRARELVIQRAEHHLRESRLVVDFYRIRRRIAYPLPIQAVRFPEFPTRLGVRYPWETWTAWAVEERVLCLGWAGTWLNRQDLRAAAEADLRGVVDFRYAQGDRLNGLARSHLLRTACAALTNWPWLAPVTRRHIGDAIRSLLDESADWMDGEASTWETRRRHADSGEPVAPLHNIQFIETVGLCLAARRVGHPRAAWLEQHVSRLVQTLLAQHERGVTEGASYDGYVLDFVADWLAEASPEHSETILQHPELARLVDEGLAVGAPGNVQDVARLGDVEPAEMPFHAAALVKLHHLGVKGHAGWAFEQYDLSRLRTDGLLALALGAASGQPATREGAPEMTDTRGSIICRSGWTKDDIAVAMSAHRSPMGHLHNDNGTVVLAAGGKWLIDDPGYQQYLPTSEREFTVGAAAHNAPLPNGRAQSVRMGTVLDPPRRDDDLWHMAVDLKDCYAPPLEKCRRDVWLVGRRLVVVADRVAARELSRIDYRWHGHPDASWWAEDGTAVLYLDGTSLWIRCLQLPLSERQIDRPRGSRGHVALSAEVPVQGEAVVCWTFGRDESLVRQLSIGDEGVLVPGLRQCLPLRA